MSLETTTNIPHAGDVIDELVIIFRHILSKVIWFFLGIYCCIISVVDVNSPTLYDCVVSEY